MLSTVCVDDFNYCWLNTRVVTVQPATEYAVDVTFSYGLPDASDCGKGLEFTLRFDKRLKKQFVPGESYVLQLAGPAEQCNAVGTRAA
jgi:hypothetical protein